MKLALCLEYPLGLRGGVSVLVENLLAELTSRGHEIVLVSPDITETLKRHKIGARVKKHIHWDPKNTSPTVAKDLAHQLAKEQVDLAHFHLGGNYGWRNRFPWSFPGYYLNRLRIPCVSTVHLVVDIFDGYCGPQKPFLFKLLMLPMAWLGKMHQLQQVQSEIAVSQHDIQKPWSFVLKGSCGNKLQAC